MKLCSTVGTNALPSHSPLQMEGSPEMRGMRLKSEVSGKQGADEQLNALGASDQTTLLDKLKLGGESQSMDDVSSTELPSQTETATEERQGAQEHLDARGAAVQTMLMEKLRRGEASQSKDDVSDTATSSRTNATKEVWSADEIAQIKEAFEGEKEILNKGREIVEKALNGDKAAKAYVKEWFGRDDEKTSNVIKERIDKMLNLLNDEKKMGYKNCRPPEVDKFPPDQLEHIQAYVYPTDKRHRIYLGPAFWTAPMTGPNSMAGTLAHEMSHFNDVGGTRDGFPTPIYGQKNSRELAEKDPDKALMHADCFTYFLENASSQKDPAPWDSYIS